MTYVKRFATLSMLLIMLMSLVGVTAAQDEYCLGLDEDDCELYYELAEAASIPVSSAFELLIDMNAEADGEELELALDITGAYVFDEVAIEDAVDEFAETPVLDVSFSTFLDLVRGVVAGFDAELSVDYELPAEMEIPPIGPFNLWLVDGVGYFDLEPLSMFDPSLEGIYGVDLVDLIEVPLQGIEVGDLLDALDFDNMGDMGLDTETGNFNFAPNVALTEEEIESFVSMERADDSEVNGTAVVVFVTSINIEAMMEIPAIVDAAYQSAVQSGFPSDVDKDDFAEAMQEALAGSTITVTESIDPETGYTLHSLIEADITIDSAPIAEITDSNDEGEITVAVTIEFTRSDVDNVDEIELPDDAQEIPVEELLGSF